MPIKDVSTRLIAVCVNRANIAGTAKVRMRLTSAAARNVPVSRCATTCMKGRNVRSGTTVDKQRLRGLPSPHALHALHAVNETIPAALSGRGVSAVATMKKVRGSAAAPIVVRGTVTELTRGASAVSMRASAMGAAWATANDVPTGARPRRAAAHEVRQRGVQPASCAVPDQAARGSRPARTETARGSDPGQSETARGAGPGGATLRGPLAPGRVRRQ